jgi:hypothetical protein
MRATEQERDASGPSKCRRRVGVEDGIHFAHAGEDDSDGLARVEGAGGSDGGEEGVMVGWEGGEGEELCGCVSVCVWRKSGVVQRRIGSMYR